MASLVSRSSSMMRTTHMARPLSPVVILPVRDRSSTFAQKSASVSLRTVTLIKSKRQGGGTRGRRPVRLLPKHGARVRLVVQLLRVVGQQDPRRGGLRGGSVDPLHVPGMSPVPFLEGQAGVVIREPR